MIVPAAFVIGAALAIFVSVLARAVGFDRDRSFYPVVLTVIASYYVLFAAMGATRRTLVLECLLMIPFAAAAAAGFKRSAWLVVAGLAAHGVFDLFHGRFVSNPGVPPWWPAFCLAYDVAAAGFLAALVARGATAAAPREPAT